MKFKKYLKSLRQQARDSLIDADSAFVDSVRDRLPEIEPMPEKSVDARPIIIVAAMMLTVAIAFILIFCIPRPTINKGYLAGNEETAQSSINELNDDLTDIEVRLDDNITVGGINRFYDSVSSDNLYYRLSLTFTDNISKKLELVIVVNDLYEYKEFKFMKEVQEDTFRGYKIKYTKDIQSGSPLKTLNAIAEIDLNGQKIYVTQYREYYLAEDGFFDTLNSILQPKTV